MILRNGVRSKIIVYFEKAFYNSSLDSAMCTSQKVGRSMHTKKAETELNVDCIEIHPRCFSYRARAFRYTFA